MTAVDVAAIRARESAGKVVEGEILEAILHVTDGQRPSGEQDAEAIGRCVEYVLANVLDPVVSALEAAVSRAEVAEAALARVEALHVRWPSAPDFCQVCAEPWPCSTVAAVRGDAT